MIPSLRRFSQLYGGVRVRLLVFLTLALLQFVSAAPLPFVVKEVFDTALPDERVELLIGLSALIVGLQFVSIAIGLISTNLLLGMSTEAVRRLRQQVFDKLYAVSIRFHETHPIGDLHDRTVHETDRVDTMMRGGIAIAVPSAIFTAGILGVLLFINWVLFLVTLAFVPAVYIINRLTRKRPSGKQSESAFVDRRIQRDIVPQFADHAANPHLGR